MQTSLQKWNIGDYKNFKFFCKHQSNSSFCRSVNGA